MTLDDLEHRPAILADPLHFNSEAGVPIFNSQAMQEIYRRVERIAPTNMPVLLTGESGTGKEVVADVIHQKSPRAKGPFLKVNCAALPRELIESELFGSVKGAYTGAAQSRQGLFRQANFGTLLLDELAEMPYETQSKLLRVLQTQEIRPVGGAETHKVDVRIVAATNQVPNEAIASGRLRADLYYRLSALELRLPPLRKRTEDILPLARAFLARYAVELGRPFTGFSNDALACLLHASWPGNVRQLQNVVSRAAVMAEGPVVEVADLSLANDGTVYLESAGALDLSLLEANERHQICQALNETQGNKRAAARLLGISPTTIYLKMKTYGLQ